MSPVQIDYEVIKQSEGGGREGRERGVEREERRDGRGERGIS